MFNRRILGADILYAKNLDVGSYSSAGDFAGGPTAVVDVPSLNSARAIPYAVHVPARRSIYVLGVDINEARRAPFAYLYLRKHAKTIVSVPWEAGPIYPQAMPADPMFVFSPGRCGSTLLHSILANAGLNCVSEPDLFSPLISVRRWPVLRPIVRHAVSNLVRDLTKAFARGEDALIVKLRAHCCLAPDAVLAPISGPRKTIFMAREFEPWAKSTVQAFGTRPVKLLRKYRAALQCYAYLTRHTECKLLRYEDLLSDQAGASRALSLFLGQPISARSVRTSMRTDSQAHTPLEKDRLKMRTRWDAVRDETLAIWKTSGLARQCLSLGLYPS